MKLFRHIITVFCVVAYFVANAGEQLTTNAKCVVNQPTNAELKLLQGTWEGVMVGDGTSKTSDFQKTSERKPGEIDLDFLRPRVFGSPHKSPEKITITITGNSLHFHRDANFWFETTITLPAGTNPKQLHATIKGPPSQASSIGKVVGAIYKIEDGTLTLADYAIPGEPPKTFADAPSSRYLLKKVQPQPQKKNAEPLKTK